MSLYLRSRRPFSLGGTMQRRHRPDYWLIILSVILLVLGLIVVYAISPALSAQSNVSGNYYVNKQLIAIILGIVGFIVVSNLPLKTWRRLETPIITAAAGAAIAVRLFGDQVNGAYRWIQIAGFSFQAAELIKFALLIWLAGFLSDRIRSAELLDKKRTLQPLVIVLLVVAAVVGLVQKDFGSTAVILVMMVVMGFIAGIPLKKLAMVGGLLAIALVLLILPFSYRRARLETFLSPSKDCLSSGYQTCQSLISVGSGGLFGKGLGRGVQAYGYQPEPANDSIFAIFAEKFGFIGTSILIGLFIAFFARLKLIMERAPDNYSRLIVAGIMAWFSSQAIINIGAMVGLLPLKGITLPFISYGGTSVLFVTIAVGMAFQISRYTSYSSAKQRQKLTGRDYGGIGQPIKYRAPNV